MKKIKLSRGSEIWGICDMMRIALYVDAFPCLSETFILNQITGLIDLGHEVTVIANQPSGEDLVHETVNHYRLEDKTVYLPRLPRNKTQLRLWAVGGIMTHLFRCPAKLINGLFVLLFKMEKFSYPLLSHFFLALTFQTRFDVIYCHFGRQGNIGALLKKTGFNAKLVTAFHGYDINVDQYTERYYDLLFDVGDLFLCNTHYTKDRLKDKGCPPDRIKVLPMGLDLKVFEYTDRSHRTNDAVHILTIGRLVQKKGYEYSLEALAALVRKGYVNLRYTIVGDGPLKHHLSAVTEKFGIKEFVFFTGPKTRKEVVDLYHRADIFLLTSVTADDGDKEGQALVLQEAQACGLPVISTFHNGIPEGVINNETGFLVKEKDAASTADCLCKLIEDKQLRTEMGRRGRKFVEEKYDNKRLNLLLENYLKST